MKDFKFLKDEKGWASLLTIMVLSVMLPIFLFFYVELNHYYKEKDKLDHITQNMASSAVRQLDEIALEKGEIVIDENDAKEVAELIMRQSYNLNSNLVPSSNSSLLSTPDVKIYVLNTPNESIKIDSHTITADKPTVVVVTAVKPTNIFFKKFITLRSLYMYEAELTEEGKKKVEIASAESLIVDEELSEPPVDEMENIGEQEEQPSPPQDELVEDELVEGELPQDGLGEDEQQQPEEQPGEQLDEQQPQEEKEPEEEKKPNNNSSKLSYEDVQFNLK